MNIELSEQAREDLCHWNRVGPSRTARIQLLLADIMKTPHSGLGKPEPLKHDLTGYWSRRIDREHRLVYRLEGETILVASCRYHYR